MAEVDRSPDGARDECRSGVDDLSVSLHLVDVDTLAALCHCEVGVNKIRRNVAMVQMKEAVYTMSKNINPDKFSLTVAGKEDLGRLPHVRPEEWAVYVVRSAVGLSRYVRDKLKVTMSTVDENNYQEVVFNESLSQLDDQVLVHGDNELVFRLRRPPGITFIVEMRLFGVSVVNSPTYDVGRSSETAKLDPADLLNMSTRMQVGIAWCFSHLMFIYSGTLKVIFNFHLTISSLECRERDH